MPLTIRPATSADAETFSALAMRAKAFWPYDQEFSKACEEDLRLSPERAGDGYLSVGEENGKILGFFGFAEGGNDPEMTHLFVEPNPIGRGLGSQLWSAALSFARDRGWQTFHLVADPYAAEKFYYRVGCRKIGEVESSVRPGRKLPLLRFDLSGQTAT